MTIVNDEDDVVVVPEIVEVKDDEGNDTTDWKAQALAAQELALKNQGIAQRYKTKLEKAKEKSEANPDKKEAKTDGIDYAQEAYLLAHGIREADEREMIEDRMKQTGKSLKEVMENKYFQQDLEGLRADKATKLAIPTNTNRSNPSTRDTVDYWKTKIEAGKATLLDIPDIKLRRQVVNSRLEKETSGSHFTDNPFGTIDIK